MNNQESMFASPERNTNNDPREQQQAYEQPPLYAQPHDANYTESEQNQSYESGYQAYDNFAAPNQQGEKIQPKPPALNRQQVTFIIVASIIFLCAGGAFGALFNLLSSLLTTFVILVLIGLFIAGIANRQSIVLPTRTFEISEHAQLNINNASGTVNIWRSQGNHIEVQATQHINRFFTNSMVESVSYTQNGDTIYVRASSWNPANFFAFTAVTLDVFVPDGSDIHVGGNVGTLHITGVKGQINAKVNSGAVRVEQAQLSDQSNVHTNAGTIHIEQSSLGNGTRFHTNAGTIHITQSQLGMGTRFHSNSGTIHVDQSQLAGSSTMTTNAGSVHVESALAPGGDYQFRTNMGTVHVALPANSAFILAATTNMGSVINDFGSNIVGSEPYARLTLHSNMGTVHVERSFS
jgi:hypothetical protein